MSILVDHIPSLSGREQRETQERAQSALGQMMHGNFIPEKTFESLAGKLLLLLVVILMCIGILAVYSSGAGWAVTKFDNDAYFLWRQAAYALLGLLVIFIVGGMDYKLLKKWSKTILIISLVLLAMLLVLKSLGVIHGAARWIGYGRFKFQASDLAKYALIIHLATMLAEKQRYIKDLERAYYPMLTVIIAVGSLVALEPNFSTASVLVVIGFTMLFIGGASLKHLVLTLVPVSALAAIFAVSASYRMERLMSFMGIGSQKASYQVEQALIGLGNGGLTGLGIGASKQRELFLPASYNDFIFAIFGEEYGFIGALVLLLLFGGIIVCGVLIAQSALDDFGKFLAYGITVAIGLYAFINAGVACHLLPTTGLPMPFVSFGGSAMLFNAFGVGVLISISRERKRLASAKKDAQANAASAIPKRD
ncbi:MAG: FtsW/RodA/SpoVE family cell cycle protein [Candidatus Thermochlorobacter sp.]